MKELLYLLIATIITILLVPIGILYNIKNSIWKGWGVGLMEGLLKFIYYWIGIFHQIIVVVEYALSNIFKLFSKERTKVTFQSFILHLAMIHDYFWNVFGGELIENFVTIREDTLFGKGNVSVSQATGKEELEEFLTVFGKQKFSPLLNWFFKEKSHCVDAYKKYMKQTFDQMRKLCGEDDFFITKDN